jgi:hypothetical protein
MKNGGNGKRLLAGRASAKKNKFLQKKKINFSGRQNPFHPFTIFLFFHKISYRFWPYGLGMDNSYRFLPAKKVSSGVASYPFIPFK